jgi:DNA (cytosine-5)-methyltransferase 1
MMPMNVLCFNRKKTVRTNYNDKSIEEVRQENMRFIDLFAGIGGFRLGMQQAGHECVGFVEWDKYARKSYETIHNTEGEWTAHDITTVSDDDLRLFRGRVDVICGGFPCQAFSVAGKRKGFEDTRGTLFFEIARFANVIRPRYLFLENVKGLLNHDRGNTFRTILGALDELGYDAEWQICNSKDFGVPQNRERVFIIGHLRGASTRKIFPFGGSHEAPGIEIVGTTAPPSRTIGQRDIVYSTDGVMGCLSAMDYKQPKQIMVIGDLNHYGQEALNRVYDEEGLSPCLDTMQGGGRQPKVMIREATKQGYAIAEVGDSINFSVPNSETRRGRVGKGVANTLDTQCNQATIVIAAMRGRNPENSSDRTVGSPTVQRLEINEKGTTNCLTSVQKDNLVVQTEPEYRIRKLTPRECFRLQGFPDWAFDKAKEVNSDSQLYKQAGNSVTVPVIYEIAKRLGVEE